MNAFKNSSVVDSIISLGTISQSFTGLAFMSFSSVSWKSIYFFLITPQWEARTAAVHGYVCSYHWRVLYLTYPSNSTRFLKETLHLRLNWVLFWFQGHCLLQGGCCTAAWPPPRVPWDMPFLCSWLSVFCIIYHEGNCLKCWPLARTFLSTFFFLSKGEKSKLHNLPALPGWPHLLFSPVWPNPAAICSPKHPGPSCTWQYIALLHEEKWTVLGVWNSFSFYSVSSFLCFVDCSQFVYTCL